MSRARLYKTEAIVLRSIRYAEADRILHLYTADRGRVGAIAKGVRRRDDVRRHATPQPLRLGERQLRRGGLHCATHCFGDDRRLANPLISGFEADLLRSLASQMVELLRNEIESAMAASAGFIASPISGLWTMSPAIRDCSTMSRARVAGSQEM